MLGGAGEEICTRRRLLSAGEHPLGTSTSKPAISDGIVANICIVRVLVSKGYYEEQNNAGKVQIWSLTHGGYQSHKGKGMLMLLLVTVTSLPNDACCSKTLG